MECCKLLIPGPFLLPVEIIELVFSYIPTKNLLAYSDIAIISEHAIHALNKGRLEISIGSRLYAFSAYDYCIGDDWKMKPIGDETTVELRSYRKQVVRSIQFQDIDGLDDFVQFMRDRPNLHPELVIVGYDTLMELYERDISSIRNTQRIILLNKFTEDRGEFMRKVSTIQLPIYGIRPTGSWSHNGHQEYLAPFQLGRCPYHLSALDLTEIDSDDLIYLPRTLKVLGISLKSNPASFKPSLPQTLESLSIQFPYRSELINEFDITSLAHLKILECRYFPVEHLDILKAPQTIENLSIVSEKLTCLASIEKYTKLNELHLSIEDADARLIFDCDFPSSIERLHFKWVCHSLEHEIGFVEGHLIPTPMPPIILPPKLRAFTLFAKSQLFCPEDYILPDSLRILSLEVDSLPSGIQLPPNLIILDLYWSQHFTGPEHLPKSLVYLGIPALPDNKDCLINLPNLTRLEMRSDYKPLTSFEWELPNTLKTLNLAFNNFKCIKLENPNLKVVNLSTNYFECLENLDLNLPDSVQDLVLSYQRYLIEGNTAKLLIKNCRLPVSLRRLDLSYNNMDTQSLTNLNLKNLRNLTLLNLRGNDIRELEQGTFPPSLKVLELDVNPQLCGLSSEVFNQLTNLQFLYLSDCSISCSRPIKFPVSLKYLCLQSNKLENIDGLVFPKNSQIKSIELQRNKFPHPIEALYRLRAKLGTRVDIKL